MKIPKLVSSTICVLQHRTVLLSLIVFIVYLGLLLLELIEPVMIL